MSDQTRSRFLMLSPSLTNFEVQKYYQNKPKFNDLCSKNNLPKTKNGAYIINLHQYESIGPHLIALYVNAENLTYFDSFGVKYIPKKSKNSLQIKILQQTFIRYKHTIE